MIQHVRLAHRRWVLAVLAAFVCLIVATAATAQLTAWNGKVHKPVWPNNGIAQRKAPGAYNMFIERGHDGKWHAWVLFGNNANQADAETMDFFSGKVMKVAANVDPDTQQQEHSFVDAMGNAHGALLGQAFESNRDLPYGIDTSVRDLHLPSTPCSMDFIAFDGGRATWNSPPKWSKVPIDRDNPTHGNLCTDGIYGSGYLSTLDLGDGTFLVTMDCWVFRLRGSDLMPVGAAPALDVIDADTVARAIAAAKHLPPSQQLAYFEKTLHLNMDAANSCR